MDDLNTLDLFFKCDNCGQKTQYDEMNDYTDEDGYEMVVCFDCYLELTDSEG